MADLVIDGDSLHLRLTSVEKAEAIHGDITVPLSSVVSAEALDNAIGAVHGIRVGTGIPGYMVVGTITDGSVKTFAVIHHRTPRGVLVRLSGASFDQLIVGNDDPEAIVSNLTRSR
jgi:hypothetical protein